MSLLSLTCYYWQVCFYSGSAIIVFLVPLWFSFIAKMKNIYINPFHAYPGPCPGIFILITMPIPDRVRASLQLIHCMLNSRQVWPDASSVLQNNIGVYYSAIWWLFGGYRPLLRSGLAVYGHFVGLIHETVAVLMFWSELKQFACIQSQCHRKLGEQQLNSIGLCRATLIHIAGIVCRFIHSLQQTQYGQQMLV